MDMRTQEEIRSLFNMFVVGQKGILDERGTESTSKTKAFMRKSASPKHAKSAASAAPVSPHR